MGLFDKILSSSSNPLRNVILDENPNRILHEISRQVMREKRKQIEDGADKIHPACGKVVKTINNLNDTVENAQDSLENGLMRKLFSPEVTEIDLADHLFVQRMGYTHHGLYIGNGTIVHYLADGIGLGSLESFADGAKIHKKSNEESPILYSKDEVINRAYRRLNEDKYNLIVNNCENFVRWCRSGAESY